MGHSQGAGHLKRLIAEEIDGEPALRDRLVSAMLLGSSVAVPDGEIVGGDFAEVPLCETEEDTGCVVSFASFRSTVPPPATSFFGRVAEEGMVAACVNPANLRGGTGAVEPYFLLEQQGGLLGAQAEPFTDPTRAEEITTPWVTYPDFVEAECVQERGFSYLALNVNADPGDPRTDDIGGDITPQWGMHLIDVNVTLGNLVDLVKRQVAAYES
jgi:hypothetical protein